ncbi:hypothetical protein ELI15_14200 [Rhizobium ruizarguesonis]|uniref:hypothetical protein n=1 Tax=Rhizobium ruizarguesonis TaxID=2081791 RepID=UPI00102F7E0C|nr:hypothetical protein [Rhizobium ruizarguesonis]TAW65442.1 hypothetical protein ELI15_14200 [Rhizobium ruizarguesonis]
MIYLAKLTTWDQPFDPALHCKNAFKAVTGKVIEQEDGPVIMSTMAARIRNPGAAWLSAQPEDYYVMSEKRRDDPAPVQLARGRITSLPSELAGKALDLEFVCVPPDEDDVMKAAADLLRTGEVDYDPDAPAADREAAERYDPVYFSPEASDDPTNVLLATTELWRWDRVTLALERVDMITGRRLFTITAGLNGSERLTLDVPPKAKTKLRVIAQWTQSANGDQTNPFMTNREVMSYTYKALIEGMSKAGDSIGNAAGWTIADAYVENVEPLLSKTYNQSFSSIWGATGQQVTVEGRSMNVTMHAHYDYTQPREEVFVATMLTGVQGILGDDREETVEELTVADITLDTTTPDWLYEDGDTLEPKSYAIGDKVQANGLCWLCVTPHEATEQFTAFLFDDDGNQTVQLWQKTAKVAAVDARVSSFFDTTRGVRATRYAIRRLHRSVQSRARCATIQADVSWMAARDMTCADEARIENRRLPGGQPVGKITYVELRIDGARRSATVKIAASVGTGVAPGAPTGNQQQTSDVVYSVQAPAVNQPVDAFALAIKAPRIVEIENEAVEQEGHMFNASSFAGKIEQALLDNPTRIRVYYDPLRSENLITRRLTATTSPIYVRKGLDLTPETP